MKARLCTSFLTELHLLSKTKEGDNMIGMDHPTTVPANYDPNEETDEECPECSEKLIVAEGCEKCSSCHYSKC